MSVKWKNAWWSRREKCWMTKRFSLLDNIDIPEGRASGVGSFAWNEVLFDSFQSGNVKALDMELYTSLKSSLTKNCGETDQPIGALLTDLKQRGMLDDTLIVWIGEFGRTPIRQGSNRY